MSLINENAPFFIELLARNGDVKTRYRFDQLPIRIGRGYNNDLILDDPYIAANHAIVEMTEAGELNAGELSIRDLGSQNGMICKDKRESHITIDDSIIRLGHTSIRIRSANFNVENEIADKTKTIVIFLIMFSS